MIPTASISDPRLRPRDRAVLGALCHFDPKQSGHCSADRKRISQVAGVHETHVSAAITRLAKMGWVARAGRTNRTVYTIHWDFDPSKLVADLATSSRGQLVADLATSSRGQLVADLATSSEAQLVADLATSSQSGYKLGQLVANPATSSSRARVKESPYGDEIKSSTPDQIRSETDSGKGITREHAPADFGITDAIEILVAYGMPLHFTASRSDRDLIASWVDNGLTETQLREACARAVEGKRDNQPIGPRYVASVLTSMRKEPKRATSECLDGKDYGSGVWSRD